MDKIERKQTVYTALILDKLDELVDWINDTNKVLKKLKNWMIKYG